MTFELIIHHQEIKPYTICSNGVSGLTLTVRSTLFPSAFVRENASIQDVIENIEDYELKVGTNSVYI